MSTTMGNVDGPMFKLTRPDHTINTDPEFFTYEVSLGYFLNEHEVRGIGKIQIECTNDLAADSFAKRLADVLFGNSGWGSAYIARRLHSDDTRSGPVLHTS